jgi:hypothetical protein
MCAALSRNVDNAIGQLARGHSLAVGAGKAACPSRRIIDAYLGFQPLEDSIRGALDQSRDYRHPAGYRMYEGIDTMLRP